ncbi:agmatinase [Caldicellulosiruptoraceae bacterium PP1]
MPSNIYKSQFLLSSDNYESSKIVIAGIPMDFTVSFKPGSRFGPSKIREVSASIEEYSVYQDKNLSDSKYIDLGDLELPFGNTKKSIDLIYEFAYDIFKDGKIPIFLGGEHLVSYPLVEAAFNFYNDIVVLHFDAHADMRDEFLGEKLSHATVMRRIGEKIGFTNIYQFGIRSGCKDEIYFAKENSNLNLIKAFEPLKKVLPYLKDRKIYLSIDIDVLDPAYAPGTGTPEAGGISSQEMIDSILLLRGLNIVGIDIVEVSPYYDNSDRTSLLAAKLIREIILAIY